jgi:hypothetical protein
MKNEFKFTWQYIENQFLAVAESGYRVLTCEEYAGAFEKSELSKILVNRVDIDFSIKKAEKLGKIFNNLGIKGTFFVRLHAAEYNPFSFENYSIIKFLIDSGHEIGYHAEIIDESVIWSEKAGDCLWRDIQVINKMFDVEISGAASHGGMTGLNNLDFWKRNSPNNYGLKYEAYDWFNDSFYVSDSEWTRWKCYDNGSLVEGDHRDLSEHVKDDHPLVYSLIHSDTYYQRHPYE